VCVWVYMKRLGKASVLEYIVGGCVLCIHTCVYKCMCMHMGNRVNTYKWTRLGMSRCIWICRGRWCIIYLCMCMCMYGINIKVEEAGNEPVYLST